MTKPARTITIKRVVKPDPNFIKQKYREKKEKLV